MAGPRINLAGRAGFDDAAAIHDADTVSIAGDDTEIMCDQDQRRVGGPRHLLEQCEDLRLNGDVERRRRLVGDDELRLAGQCHGDHGALAHAAGELVWIGLQPTLGVGQAHAGQQIRRHVHRRRPRRLAVQVDRLGNLQADRERGIEGAHRLLENHGDAVAADRPDFLILQLEEVAAVEHHFAGGDAAGRIGNQAQDRHGSHALARARLAHDGQGLAG